MDIEIDSDFEDMLEVDIDGSTIVPYSFEPLRTERGKEHENNRPVSEWCNCSDCIDMPTAIECKCCKSNNVVDGKADRLQCIRDHEGFAVNCLETSYFEYVLENGPMKEGEVIHELYQYKAY